MVLSRVCQDHPRRHPSQAGGASIGTGLGHTDTIAKLEAVGQLTGSIAHDFNNVLTAILGSLELLEVRQERFSTSAARMLKVIRHAADHGAELTRRLLTFSRKQAFAPTMTDVNSLMSGLLELLRRTLGRQLSSTRFSTRLNRGSNRIDQVRRRCQAIVIATFGGDFSVCRITQ